MATQKKSVLIVFKHYEIPDNANGTFKAKCKHCTTTISGSTKATSNFVLHIKVCETIITQEFSLVINFLSCCFRESIKHAS